MSYSINVLSWNNTQVIGWLLGLEPCLSCYIPAFERQNINGAQLLKLTYDLLESQLGIALIGHQEVLLECIEALVSLNYELPRENAQSLALILCCDSANLNNLIKRLHNEEHKDKLPLLVLQYIYKITQSLKAFVNWIDRPPFDSSQGYLKLRTQLLRYALQWIQCGQHVTASSLPSISKTCEAVITLMKRLIVEGRDSLIIQPVFLQRAVLRKLPQQSLGMTLETSSSSGVHIIGGITNESPADACGNIEIGDEIIQVGQHTVIGWQLNCLVDLLKVTREVTLTLKKRPRHTTSTSDRIRNIGSTTPLSKSFRHSRKSSKRANRTASKPETSTAVASATLASAGSASDSMNTNKGDNNNLFISLSPLNSVLANNQLIEIKYQADSKQRRATVSGGSPRLMSISGSTKATTAESDDAIYSCGDHVHNDDAFSSSLDEPVFNENDTIAEEDEDKAILPEPSDNNRLQVQDKVNRISDNSFSDSGGYEVKVIAGVSMKIKMTSDDIAPLSKIHYRIKNKLHNRADVQRRRESKRISCLLLGHCECKGWLWLRRSLSFLSEPWKKMWFALRHHRLYYYKSPESVVATGVLLMPLFTLSPAPEVKDRKKFAFKAYNSKRKFYFYCERQFDMSKWMNQLGLAAIDYTSDDNESAFSGSDEETAVDLNIVTPKTNHAIYANISKPKSVGPATSSKKHANTHSNNELTTSKIAEHNQTTSKTANIPHDPTSKTPEVAHEFTKAKKLEVPSRNCVRMRSSEGGQAFRNRIINSIHEAGLAIDGRNVSMLRRTALLSVTDAIEVMRSSCIHPTDINRSSRLLDLYRRLAALQRTKKDMTKELEDIDWLLLHVTSDNLLTYQLKYRYA